MTVRRINYFEWSVYDGPVRIAIVSRTIPGVFSIVRGVLDNRDMLPVARALDAAIRQESEQATKRELLKGGI